VGGEPTAAADVGTGAAAIVEVDRWSRGGTPSGTLGEHFWMELPQPSSIERHALLQLGGETDHEAVLLLVRVHLVRCILWQVVEQL
jgi:hypothetical protein